VTLFRGKEKRGGRKEKRGGMRKRTGGEGKEGDRREKHIPACPSHLHCIQTLYARFGRSVLKIRS
jgi:ribosomal protein L15